MSSSAAKSWTSRGSRSAGTRSKRAWCCMWSSTHRSNALRMSQTSSGRSGKRSRRARSGIAWCAWPRSNTSALQTAQRSWRMAALRNSRSALDTDALLDDSDRRKQIRRDAVHQIIVLPLLKRDPMHDRSEALAKSGEGFALYAGHEHELGAGGDSGDVAHLVARDRLDVVELRSE